MSVKVKPLVFTSTPDDSLVVVDVYAGGSTSTEPLNLVQKLTNETSGTLSKILGGMNTNKAGLFKKAADFVLSNKDFKSKDFAKTMLGEVFPNAKTALNDLKGGLINTVAQSVGLNADTALAAYRSVKDGDYNNVLSQMATSNPLVKLYLDGHEIVKRAEDVDSLGDLFNVAGSIFGNTQIGKVLNLGEEFSALKGLVDAAVSLRAPELADYLISKVDDNHKDRLKRATAQQAARSGDLYTFYSYLYQMNVAEALAEDPDMTTNLLSTYRHPTENGPTIEDANMLVSILDKINPNWNGSVTGRPDVSIWLDVSDDLRELVYMDGRYVPLLISADDVRVESFEESVGRTMNWVTLKEGTAQNLI